jgi:acyl-CoA reductase-like NAD-dependent aldehyde dehydrogenase
MIGAQVSAAQLEKISSYVQIGLDEGAQCLAGGHRAEVEGGFTDGYYFEPTLLKGHNKMRVFQEEIFGPVLAVTTFTDEADALAIANDTLYGLGAGVWTRDAHGPTEWAAPSRPAGSGPTAATTSTPQAPRSAGTRPQASAERPTG